MAYGADSLEAAGAKAALAAQTAIRARFGREDADVTCAYPHHILVCVSCSSLMGVRFALLQVPGRC